MHRWAGAAPALRSGLLTRPQRGPEVSCGFGRPAVAGAVGSGDPTAARRRFRRVGRAQRRPTGAWFLRNDPGGPALRLTRPDALPAAEGRDAIGRAEVR